MPNPQIAPEGGEWILSKQKGRDMHAGTFVEAICPHGIGHHKGVHGCDGCCAHWPKEISDEVTEDVPPTPKDWRERFLEDRLIGERFRVWKEGDPTCWHVNYIEIEKFIEQLLAEERQLLLEKVEGIATPRETSPYAQGYNEAVDDFKRLIRGE
jgi:hypothetical protein